MSEATVQFVELVREAHAKITEPVYYIYCNECGGRTAHKLKVRGRWEHYSCCACGCQSSYKVR